MSICKKRSTSDFPWLRHRPVFSLFVYFAATRVNLKVLKTVATLAFSPFVVCKRWKLRGTIDHKNDCFRVNDDQCERLSLGLGCDFWHQRVVLWRERLRVLTCSHPFPNSIYGSSHREAFSVDMLLPTSESTGMNIIIDGFPMMVSKWKKGRKMIVRSYK